MIKEHAELQQKPPDQLINGFVLAMVLQTCLIVFALHADLL